MPYQVKDRNQHTNPIPVSRLTQLRSVQVSFTLKLNEKRQLERKLGQLGIRVWGIIRRRVKVEVIGRLWVLKLGRRRVWMEGLKVMLLGIGD
jgi:hypothetical protein